MIPTTQMRVKTNRTSFLRGDRSVHGTKNVKTCHSTTRATRTSLMHVKNVGALRY